MPIKVKVKKFGGGTLYVRVPKPVAEYENIKEGDEIEYIILKGINNEKEGYKKVNI